MKNYVGFSFGFILVVMVSFLFRIIGFPYDVSAIHTVQDFIACLISSLLFTGAIVLFVGLSHNLRAARIGRAFTFSTVCTILGIAARYAVQKRFGVNAVAVSYALDALMIVAIAWCCRSADETPYSSVISTVKRYAWSLTVLLIGIGAVMVAVQGIIYRRCSGIYVMGSPSYDFSYHRLQWIVTAGGFLVTTLTTLVCLPFLNRSKRYGSGKRLYVAFLLLLILFGTAYLRIKAVIVHEGTVVRIVTSSSRSNREIYAEKKYVQPSWADSSRKEIERWGGTQASAEVLNVKSVYDAEGKLRGRAIVTDPSNYFTLLAGETLVGVEYPYFLMFFDGNQQKIYSLDKLEKAELSEVLLEFARGRIDAMDFRLFEQCAAYLCRYDTKFVQPILLRYAIMEFSVKERIMMGDIRPECIYDVSRRLLSRIKD